MYNLLVDKSQIDYAQDLSNRFNLKIITVPDVIQPYILSLTNTGLELISTQSNYNPIKIDFVSGQLAHREKQNELLVKALNLKKNKNPTIIDATGGLGRDAFIMAAHGCEVLILERHPVLAALLYDALNRLHSEKPNQYHIKLEYTNAISYLKNLDAQNQPDIIYLDPMHPERKKSSLVKKEMRIIRDLVGADTDATELFTIAYHKARQRIIVKRPLHAENITEKSPNYTYKGKHTRFDIFIPAVAAL